MDTNPYRAASVRSLLTTGIILLASAMGSVAGHAAPPLRPGPIVWHEDDRRPIPVPSERDPGIVRDFYDDSISRPAARHLDPEPLSRKIGTIFGGQVAREAVNVNALDEVPNSAWFTNRIGLFAHTPEEVRAGPGEAGPSREAPWTVVAGKVGGVTAGFQIRDAAGGRFLLKFDPKDQWGTTSSAGAVSVALFHAAGYNVPEDVVVDFTREDLRLSDGVRIERRGEEVALTEALLDEILADVPRSSDGGFRALASRFLSGKPLGPFDYKGRRQDDPNDHFEHEHRRELRGLRLLAAWTHHFDMKQHNSLDMYVGEPGAGHVVHHLIDFASTLGAGGRGAEPILGREYGIDLPAGFGRLLALGLHEDPWRSVERPVGLDEVGYYDAESFHPTKFKPQQPNTAFAHLTDRDGYWAAKIVSSFRDEHIRAAVERGRYADPDAAAYVARVLGARRDRIAAHWFAKVAPLDYFSRSGSQVHFRDLARERLPHELVARASLGRYRARVARVSAERERTGRWSEWIELPEPSADLGSGPLAAALNGSGAGAGGEYLALQLVAAREGGWSPAVTAYSTLDGDRIVAVER